MNPYYNHAGVTIYHGDCREVLPTIGQVDLVLTDPPYGIGYIPRKINNKEKRAQFAVYGQELITGGAETPDVKFLLEYGKDAIIWGGNYFADQLPPVASWLVWDKKGGNPKFHGQLTFADCELAWCSDNKPARIFQFIWSGLVRQGPEGQYARMHPNQKPQALMAWCINRFPSSARLCDPYMGCGSSLLAAKQFGRRAIGIEIEEKYCEVAAKRLSQEMLPFEETIP
jgi:site-specific DNA-methyltransferase (adenine-specific)